MNCTHMTLSDWMIGVSVGPIIFFPSDNMILTVSIPNYILHSSVAEIVIYKYIEGI